MAARQATEGWQGVTPEETGTLWNDRLKKVAQGLIDPTASLDVANIRGLIAQPLKGGEFEPQHIDPDAIRKDILGMIEASYAAGERAIEDGGRDDNKIKIGHLVKLFGDNLVGIFVQALQTHLGDLKDTIEGRNPLRRGWQRLLGKEKPSYKMPNLTGSVEDLDETTLDRIEIVERTYELAQKQYTTKEQAKVAIIQALTDIIIRIATARDQLREALRSSFLNEETTPAEVTAAKQLLDILSDTTKSFYRIAKQNTQAAELPVIVNRGIERAQEYIAEHTASPERASLTALHKDNDMFNSMGSIELIMGRLEELLTKHTREQMGTFLRPVIAEAA